MEQHTHTYTGGKRLRDGETETKRERGKEGGEYYAAVNSSSL